MAWRLLLVVMLALASCTRRPKDDMRIGVVGALTGPQSTYGTSMKNGVDLAIAERNAKGPLLGRKVTAVHLDAQGRANEGVMVAERLIGRDRVHVIIGDATTSGSAAIAPVAQRAHVPMISPAATSSDVTQMGAFVFGASFVDEDQADALAQFARETLELTSFATLHDVNSRYSIGLSAAFSKSALARGGQIVAKEVYAVGDTDFAPVISALRASGAAAVFIPGYARDVATVTLAIRAELEAIVLLGADGWDSSELIERAGAAIDGGYFTTHYHPDDPRAGVRAFAKRYHDAYNEMPDAIAALGFDAAMVAMDAVERAGSLEPDAMREALAATERFEGTTGRITLDNAGRATKPVIIAQVKGGKTVFIKSVRGP